MAAAASVTGLVTWARSLVRSRCPGRRLSLSGPRPEAATIPVNRSLNDHGNGLRRGARGGGGGSLVAGRGGGAAAAAVAVAPAPALSAMRRGSLEQELAVAAAVAAAEEEEEEEEQQLSVDAGASGEPECPAREEQPKAALPAPAQPRAAEEGDVRVSRRLPPALPLAPPRPAARALCQLAKGRSRSRGRGRGYRRGSGSLRPVTVDSSKARTSLEALKISLRQLRWKEVRPAAAWARGVVLPGPEPLSRAAQPLPWLRMFVVSVTDFHFLHLSPI